MLSLRPLASSALALLGLAATLGFSRTAHAEITTITSKVNFGADKFFDELIIDTNGVLQITSIAGKGKGKIRIGARKITVKAGGKITASGVGYAGVNKADGGAEPSSDGAGKRSTVSGEPGGGGGYAGAGSNGASKDCAPLPKAGGGLAFAQPTPDAPILGSAGGAANVTSSASAGGNGGGVIILEAADIQIDGTIEADGNSPIPASGVAPGGGSGGFIAIIAANLSGTGTISAHGGSGPAAPGVAPSINANHGGGGGGGVIFLQARNVPSTIKSNLAGGATGNCAMLVAKPGTLTVSPNDPTFCVDADEDGYLSDACGGDDCNDTDPTVHPKAKEVCNGVDDNCDTDVDEGVDICAAGSTCDAKAKMCVGGGDAGADAGPGDVGSPPDYIAFESGCSIGDSERPLGALALMGLGLGALVMRRRRAPASTKADR